MTAIPLAYQTCPERLPPFIRIGGVIGFIGLTLSALLLPVWLFRPHAGTTYREIVEVVVPSFQFMCGGAGATLIFAGTLASHYRRRGVVWICLLLNVAVICAACYELNRQRVERTRWTCLHSVF